MVLFPNCKINLGLNVTGKRPDGYHDLDTVFYPLPLKDALEVSLSNGVKKETELVVTGRSVPGDPAQNLCVKAWRLLKKDFPDISAVKIHLHKVIPMGAGLGGGSANGAFTLQALNILFGLDLSMPQLAGYALQLGSDCPFFLINKPCHATGRGELLEEISISLQDYHFVVIKPAIEIKTSWAFSQIPSILPAEEAASPIRDIVHQPVEYWRQHLKNGFEKAVFEEHPLLKKIRDDLYAAGADYAAMTGTGSCIFGLFKTPPDALSLQPMKQYTVYHIKPVP